MNPPNPKPWYREPWPWILMAGPAIVVVAGIATTVLAVSSADGLVVDDYYRQGLGVNRVIAREERAQALHVTAAVQFNEERNRVRVILGAAEAPAALKLAVVHPTLPAADQAIVLAALSPGVYEGAMAAPRGGRARLRLEDEAGRWRLTGEWATKESAVRLVPRAEGP